MAFWLLVFLLAYLTNSVQALYTAKGSPCEAKCNNGKGSWYTDLVCADDDFDTVAKGQTQKECMTCLSQSLYINSSYADGNTDQYWFLFHMKYTQQSCLYDNTMLNADQTQHCTDECEGLATALKALWISSHPFKVQYGYCTQDSSSYTKNAAKCSSCLKAQRGSVIVGNMVDTMSGACDTKPFPKNGEVIQQPRNIFDSSTIATALPTTTTSDQPTSTASSSVTLSTTISATSIANPSASSSPSATATNVGVSNSADQKNSEESHHQLSTGAVLAIALTVGLGGIAAIVAAAVYFLLRHKRKQNETTPSSDAIALFEKPRNEPTPIYSELDPYSYPIQYPPHVGKFAETSVRGLHEAGDGQTHPRIELDASPRR